MTQTIDNDTAAPANPWRRTRSIGDGRTSLLFWLTMLALGGVAWGCVTWGAANLLAKKGPEKLLRVDLFLPKLNSNHTSGPTPSEQAHPKDRPTTALHLPALFGHSQVKVVETPHHVEPPASTSEPPRLTTGSWMNPIAPLTPPAGRNRMPPASFQLVSEDETSGTGKGVGEPPICGSDICTH